MPARAILTGYSMSLAQRVLIRGSAFRLARGIAYGPEPRQALDIYTPKEGAPAATVVFFYGGSWKSGDRGLYRFLGHALAQRGYQAVIADYRLFPDVRYPAFVEDAALAVAWTKANIETHGGTADRVVLMGHSAGAYNAVMLAIDPRWLAPHGLRPADIAAAVSLAGPLSFNPLGTDSTRNIFAPAAADAEGARPVKLAAAGAEGAPPFLFLHGEADRTVGAQNATNMARAVNEAGGRAAVKLYPRVGHLGLVTSFAWPLRWQAPCLDDVTLFMASAAAAAGAR